VQRNGEPEAIGFLSGPVEILKMARRARSLALELEDGTTLPATVLEVSRFDMALVAFDPKLLPQNRDKPDE
jgi:hypothetical protein